MARWLLIPLDSAPPSGGGCGSTLLLLAIVIGIPGALIYQGCRHVFHIDEKEAQEQKQQAAKDYQIGQAAPHWGYIVEDMPSKARFDHKRCVYITDVVPYSPASGPLRLSIYHSGDEVYDTIVRVNGIRVKSTSEFYKAVDQDKGASLLLQDCYGEYPSGRAKYFDFRIKR